MISVLIPVYEVPVPWLREAIGSVESELDRFEEAHPSYAATEIIVVDDGSEQEDLLDELAALGGRARVVHLGTNLGVAGALNEGLTECANEMVARFDADDVMLPGRLSEQYSRMSRDIEVSCLSTGLNYMRETDSGWEVDPSPVIHPERVTRELASQSFWFMNHPTVMMRKSHVLQAGGYDGALRGFSEDYELWVRMLLNGFTLRNLQKSYHHLRISRKSATKSFNPSNWEFLQRTQARLRA